MEEKISILKKWVQKSDNIVFFGGAGVSTESGIPDFRSVDGLYNQKYDYPPETILSHTFYMQRKTDFYKFYRDKMIVKDVLPNVTHNRLAQLEAEGKLKAIVTQNIDGLHQLAGSKTVYELHGSVLRNYCEKCRKYYDLSLIEKSAEEPDGIPKCSCGGHVKPDVVLYEEGLDDATVDGAIRAIADADVLIVGGTSLTVYPAAGLLRYYRGNKLVLINRDKTGFDDKADLVLNCGLGEVFSKI